MGQMVVHCCSLIDRWSIIDRGFRGSVLLFHSELIPDFYLIINAPNAIRKDLAGAPFSVGKLAAYSDSNSSHGII
jgi:hypothetical protein